MNRKTFLIMSVLAATVTVSVFGWDATVSHMAVAAVLARVLLMAVPASFAMPGVPGRADGSDEEMLKQLVKEFKESRDEVRQKQTELKTARDELMNRLEKGEKVHQELKDNIDKQITEINEVKSKMSEALQKLEAVKKQNDVQIDLKTYGRQIVENEEGMKRLKNGASHRFVLKHTEYKDVDRAAAAGLVPNRYQDSLVSLERQGLTIRDLLTVIPISTDGVEYAQQVLRQNNARPVPEKGSKPYSNYAWEKRTAKIIVVAHLAKLTMQAVQDAPRLVAEVDSEMRYGLGLAEEQQLLNGDGQGDNILGIMPQATPFAIPAGITPSNVVTKIDKLRIAQLQNALAFAPADAQLLNPVDWADIELTRRDPDGGGGYLFANVQGTVNPILWGLRVVQTPAMEVDNFLVGAFKYGAHLYDRMDTQVLISTENTDDFEKNMATMRCESRIGLGVRRTYAFTKGTFSGGSGS